jgi:signal transduction histidine kinase
LAHGLCIEPNKVQKKFPDDVGLQRMGAEAYVGKALTDSSGQALGVAIVLFREPVDDPTLAVSMLGIFAARAAVEVERGRTESERQKLEAQLRQAQKMEEIGQLTGGIAHDFQNLLSVILLNTELMRESAKEGQAVSLEEIQEVEDAAQQAANMTRKLLGFGRRADLSLVWTEVGSVVKGMSAMLRRVIPENIEVSIRVEEGLGKVKADPGAVEQILLNFATNARDAMPGGGALTVELKGVSLTPEEAAVIPGGREGEFLALFVSDTGVGIDEEVKARVFEPFFTTKPVGEGTGLGLAMAFGLARQHGGFLNLESKVGKGTRVGLFLPRVGQDPAEASSRPERVAAQGGDETLLVVEDQAALRRTLKLVLERAGYQVILAEDGQEGLELALERGDQMDLIISDLVMPRMGGVELFQGLKEHNLTLPFIIASGYAGKSASGLAELDPSVPVLKKPWKPGDLLHLVREMLDRE